MLAAFFRVFFSFFDVCWVSARLLPPQGGESVAPYQAFGAHPLMQITEAYISCIVLNLCTPILHLFSKLYKRILQIQQMTQKPPRSPVTETGAVIYTLLVLFQALTQLLAGVLDRSLSGCQNYRAFATVICRFFNTLYHQRTASLY